MITCSCPGATALTPIPAQNCAVDFGQIQKVIFQRLRAADGTANTIAAADVAKKTAWTALLAATDGTKITMSPYIGSPAEDGGDAITYGSGNDVPNGIPIVIGSNPVNFTGQVRQADQTTVIAAMEDLICEAQGNNLGVWLVNQNGQIEGIKNADGSFSPRPIQAFFVGEKRHGGLQEPDNNPISWSWVTGYGKMVAIITPEEGFNPLTDLIPAE